MLNYPPFGRLARLRFESPERDQAIQRSQTIYRELSQLPGAAAVDLLGPSEAFLERAKGIYRWDLLLKGRELQALRSLLGAARQLCASRKWPFAVDVDPYGAG